MTQPAAIAIIGMGLRLPGAESLDGLWQHLAAARSLITEVPAQRWDKEAWRGNPARGNKTASIWGGFVADADCFDAGFFAISPREAAWMDPQQRFALEMAWHAIEDAGYRASALAGSRTGVFMGVCHWDYAELLEKHLAAVDAYTPTGIAFSIIANRVSHFFDLRGPSVTNDTACAASMTAVHDAVAALRAGQCDMALAGGVNLIWSPNHFVAFSKAGMLSRNGRAKAFDEAADGYVRGEGGAVLLLKPLEQALADGDPIHGVIRGIGINHGGRTNSLTVTNPEAQAALIAEVLAGAGLTPADIAYLEAHGPGTPLGDPIEIAGLKQAFARLHAAAGTEPRPGAIGIGSVKTNMGHLEGAAGVAGMVKVLAALRHGQLPANVGFQHLNRLIDLSGSDFRIQAEATPWPPLPGAPRRAGVSSFGFGGSNGHVVIEEAPQVPPAKPGRGAVVLPFSARDDGRLRALAAALRDFAAQPPAGVTLADLALTLQSGREVLDARAAITAATWEQAVTALEALLADRPHPGLLLPGGDGSGPGQDWVNGKEMTWPKRKARRIHAPLYPFDRQRHWLDLSVPLKDDAAIAHPLLHRNVSDFAGLRWQTRLPGDAPVWADHHVGGVRVLPGMAALEMARAAAERGTGSNAAGWSFTDWMWTRPVLDGGGVTEIESVLHRQGDVLAFTLAQADGERVRGSLRPLSGEAPAALDLAALRAAAPRIVPPAECYARLRADGVEHGPAFQVLTHIQAGDGFVLAQIKLGRRQQPALAEMPLHPVVLDAAIQAWAALDGDHPPGAAVPFACRRLDMWGPCEPVMWARIRRASVPQAEGLIRLDIELLDKDGSPRVVFHDLSLRAMSAAPSVAAPFLAAGAWRDRPLPPRNDAGRTVTVVLAGLSDGPPGAIPLPAANPEDPAAWIAALHGILRDRLRGQERQRILVLADGALPPLLTRPLAALLMTARQEQPRLDGALVQVAGSITPERLAAIVAAEATRGDGWPELRHEGDGRRLAWVPEEITAAAPPLALTPGATYWITGGLGGLGRIFARWLLQRGAGQVVLSGRAEIAADDARLAELGERVRYVACDLTDRHAVAAAVAGMPGLRGIIHAAGVLDDAYMLTRAADAASAVLAPKLAGTLVLDAATRGLDLDFLVLCSSVAARFGNAGQAEYAAANAFMDGFAEGAQHRTVLSVGWPLWAEGGMGVDAATQAALTRRFGTIPMPTATGLAALEHLLAAGAPACATVLHGRPERLRQMLAEFGQGAPEAAPAAPPTARPADLEARAQDFLRAVLADVLHLEPAQIRVNRKLDEYGLDSIAIVEATNRLEESLGPLSKTLFFEYVDVAGIAAHLVAEHGAALTGALGDAPTAAAAQPERVAIETIRARPAAEDGRGTHDVAIIGLSLKVAKAGDQQAFWDMLAQGLHGFEPYPADRWNHAALLHPERDVLGKTVVKTGCFLDDIAAFDPRYFRISQYEAELMSPEVRLFLQTSVEAFEDAGYSRETMRTRMGGDVAVIMGSMTNEYDLYGFQNMLMRGSLASGSYTGTVPNMVSYFYGFTGPSYFLDTMCSASSTCVHEAVHMLRAGRCRMALAGGISLLLHPQKLIATSQEHFTSKTAEVIRGYGLGADGTILGEGVGALVLKRLADAERDGDHIYGIIRGTAISNAGVRNGFTVPNPHQQAAAIAQALDDAGITADTIGYVEGHGSGTALGDPIEVKALTQAWRRHTDTVQTCPIGTVKSNVGHLLAASGLAGIVKVLMQMRHGMLAPSLHAETLNPNIPFAQTPFVVQRRLEPWTRRTDASGAEIPRRAGITSIGAGGMNSHIVIEEYSAPPAATADAGPHILVLSAMGEAQLAEVARRFHAHLLTHPEQSLADLAYTLQVGRNQLPCRMAVVVADRAAAAARLAAFIAAPGAAPGLHYARSILECDPLPADLGNPQSVAAAWVSGSEVDWDSLHAGRQPRRLSLPSYPFERLRCWYPEWPDAPSVVQPLGSRLKLHPLIGENRSDLSGLRYTTRLYLDELRDYVQKRDRHPEMLPLAALEAMLAVARVAGVGGPLALADLRVLADMDWAKAQELTAELDAESVRLAVDGIAWAEARLMPGRPRPVPSNSGGTRIEAAELYERLRQRGYDFAPYLESVAHAVLAPGGAVTCVLRADPPQQDHFKRGTCIAAPALAAAFQALLLATDGPAVLAGMDGALLNGTAPIAQIIAAPEGDGFGLWFLDGDGAVMAACHGVRLAASANTASAAQPQSAEADPRLVLAHELRAHAAELLKFPAEQLGLREAFHDLGFDSISLARLAAALSTAYNITLSPAVFFEAEHVEALAEHLMARHGISPAARPAQPARAAQPVRRAAAPGRRDGVAIIGMAGRFPGADSIPALFDRLLAGDDLTGPAPAARGFKNPWRGGFLTDVDRFDAALFRVSPVEAERMDPQQRLMLETAWRCLEDAGLRPEDLPAATAVYVGASALDYGQLLREAGISDGYAATGNSLAMIANRLSHFFNWSGASQTIDTACSSSLVALVRGAEAVRRGDCPAALVGGVNLTLAESGFQGPAQAGMLSPDGRCKAFGAAADGYGRGEGVVAVLLKRLDQAERDGDRILGVLVGTAENHGGRAGSLTAPSVTAQAALLRAAWASIDPTDLSYIEAHGTGTELGDPVELNGLRRAWEAATGSATAPHASVAVGTLKANIGHLEAAAGLAGLVKILAAMQRGRLPASLHCQPPNPHLELAGGPFRLLREAEDWPQDGRPRLAGLSSFGFGGANAHVVVADPPATTHPHRAPLPPRAFADTRFWLPGRRDATLVFTPFWQAAAAGAPPRPQRLVIAAGITVTDARVRVVDAPADPAALAPRLLALLQEVLASDTLVQLVVPLGAAAAGLGGMLDTACLESPRLRGQVIEVAPGIAAAELTRLLAAEDGDSRVRYQNGQRLVRRWRELAADGAAPWRPRGVFLITGANGGLGRLLARHIAATVPGAVLVLTGSRPEDGERAALVDEVRRLGAVAAYRQTDMADGAAVQALVRHVTEVHGRLDVVLHCAGTLRDGWLKTKRAEDVAAVMAPKADGAAALIAACAGVDLDALVLFSSLAGAFGNAGQADYAAANGVLDALAEAHGLPVMSIDWPLWAEGGMKVDDSTADALFQRMGQRPLSSRAGLAELERIVAAKVSRAAVLAGDETRIRAFFAAEPEAVNQSPLAEQVATRLAGLFAQAGGFAPGAVDVQVPLEQYGIDSLMITRLNAALGDVFASLPKTLFFQYRTLAEVAGHLAASHESACRHWLGSTAAVAPVAVQVLAPARDATDEPIAIIGIAGRYPGADSLEQFWDNLCAGRDMVGEIPAERWRLDGFYTADRDRAAAEGLSYGKWGAFLDGFADFDPLFFRISPRDAAAMDPQERLFLMCAWAAAEDAGYAPARLAAANPVGVFVGITKTGFALYDPFPGAGGALVRPQTSFAGAANRVSHALDLTGPSVAVDTMCSASLTALHQACESLRAGRVSMALAGGVNLYLHPRTFVDLSAARMLSPQGRCAAFGAGADGFVPGEGVGCVVLKPLSRALADGDRIHAVIRATAINHGGHSNGYTVPNPAAQRDLVRDALAQAGLSARDVTCMEAHGTGTELGDPIELEGLIQAFAPDTGERGFCALGSVKSAIGHLEAAAGIAGVTKMVLALRHRQVPPTLHADSVNPNLRLEHSPFVLHRALGPWPSGPRVACVSSFGAGGANAHAILAEGPAATVTTDSAPQAILLSARTPERLRVQAANLLAALQDRPVLDGAALRARLAELLGVAAADIDGAEDFDSLGLEPAQRLALLRWVEDQSGQKVDAALFAHLSTLDQLAAHLGGGTCALALADIAHTLQVGREAMEHRLGLVAKSVPDLAARLRRWLDGDNCAVRLGHAPPPGIADDGRAARWWQEGRLDELVTAWVDGLRVEWTSLPRPARPAIVSLPTYPFERQRFWLPEVTDGSAIITAPRGDAGLEADATALDRAIAPILARILADTPNVIPALARWRDAAHALQGDAAPAADPWAAWRALGAPTAQMKLAETCLRALPDILTGKRAATAIMFPDGRLDLVEAVYKDNPVAARFSRTLAQAAAAFVTALPRARVLEIGAGTGGTSEPVFAALAPHWDRVAEYRYTDLSRAFLIHAERTYGPRVPPLTTALFDVEKPLAGQDVTPGGYDLVIAANVLHATADMGRTLGHVRQLLAPGGVLLLNETASATLFTHVTFGLLDGWWRFTDPQRRIPGTPSLSPDSWRAVLAESGFDWLAGSSPGECALGQQILAARATGPQPQTAAAAAPVAGDLGQRLRTAIGETLNMAATAIDPARSFADYGLDSILGAELVHRLRRDLGVRLDQADLFDHKNLAELEAFLAGQSAAPVVITARPAAEQPIAIVGYAGRFAKSADAEALWRHLAAGRDLVEPASRFDLDALYRDAAPGSYGRHGSFLDDVAAFDPAFFGISGLEARYMDPQQRLFLEEAWKTLEHAGHAGPDIHGRRVGVFAGCSSGDYDALFGKDVPGQAFWGNTASLVPARIAYFLDLKGPAVTVDTACSSSLVAVHLACRALWDGECDMALAGGVFVQSTARFFRSANQAGMLSPSGRCAAFGAGADGIVPGEAVGAVLLRPLADALADGDTIHGVIVASGTNQDGTTNGITAPSAQSQERLIRSVYDRFGIAPDSVGLVEAHGTGTPLGDPIEHAALARAFGPLPAGSVLLGSVKSNIGHATTAAGIAGLIKVLLSLKHGTVPPTLHFNGGNPAIRFAEAPFAVNSTPAPWPHAHRRAAISSFGFSGTNAHVVVDQPPAPAPRPHAPGPYLFMLGGRDRALLRRQALALAEYVGEHPELAAADIAFTLAAGRRPLHHRLALIAADTAELQSRLRRWLNGDEDSVIGAAEIPGTITEPATGDLEAIARAVLAGAALPLARLFPQGGTRVPLPATILAATRCWVTDAATTPAPVALRAALPLRLPPAETLAGPFTPQAPMRVTLAPLKNDGRIERRTAAEGVRHLVVTGPADVAAELAAAGTDQTLRVVMVEGAATLPRCALPVVAVAGASGADFTAASPEAALALAEQIAQAPRLALVELKRTMSRPGRVPQDVLPEWRNVWTEAAAAPAWNGSEAPLALTSERVEATLFDDGVVLLRMVERADKNCFTDALMDGLSEAFAAIARLPQAKAVVLTGFDGYFACGGTRDGLSALQQGATRFTDRKIYSLPLSCPLPVIAAMQGHAIGAGWSLGLFCDHALFATEGVYHSNYLWFGFTPGAGATLIFPARLGDALGREVLFTAREYRGRELAGRLPSLAVLPAAQVEAQALALAHGLARQDRDHLTALKARAVAPLAERLDAVFAEELDMHTRTFVGNDRVRERIDRMFPTATPPSTPARPDLRRQVVDSLAEELMIDAADIRDGAGFLELGLDSILAVTWLRKLNALLGTDLPATAVYAHPTIGALVEHLGGLRQPEAVPPAPAPAPAPAQPLRRQVVDSLAEELMIDAADIRDGAGFLELGLDSILAVTWLRKLNAQLGTDLPATAVYAHPTLGALVAHLSSLRPQPVQAPAPVPVPVPPPAPAIIAPRAATTPEAVAIIGASGRFPKSRDLDAFWDNIRAGRDCIEDVPPSRWDVARFYHPDPLHPGTSYCKWMGVIDDVECFDAGFFTMTPREAALMDPQQRLFLEHAWQAFEDAALDPSALGGSTCGVFVGAGPSGYADRIAEHNAYSLLGRSSSILAARIAHLLDLRGPCIALDTACSSSLVAIAEACDSLLLGNCDMALAGGVSVMIGPEMFIDTSKVSMLSKDGRCFTFDSRANGFVPGEGAGVLLLKRLADAERDGDPIHAVIRGWGTNQDGRTNGITAPNPQAQSRLIQAVHRRFAIDPASVGLVECHGTGTPLGDPIEIEGLTGAFAGTKMAAGSCAIGSLKSNMGHMLAAAGVAGVIKAMQAVERAEIPPSIHFETLNEHIRLDGTPFAVATKAAPWQQQRRRAGVSSFGFSGTNAHVVVENAPVPPPGARPGPWLLVLSARHPAQLADMAASLRRFVLAHGDVDLGDVAHTLQIGRKAQPCRLAAVFSDRDSLLHLLDKAAAGHSAPGLHLSRGDGAAAPFDDDDARALAARWLTSGDAAKLDKAARLWADGMALDWRAAPPGRRLHLPGTVFARDRHWIEAQTEAPPPAIAHPLLTDATASAAFTVAPPAGNGLGLPELARAAAERASGRPVLGLRHLMWGAAPAGGSRLEVEVAVEADGQGWLYRVAAVDAPLAPLHLGEVDEAPALPPPADIAALCSGHSVDIPGIAQAWRQGGRLTARLELPSSDMLFDPAMLGLLVRVLAVHAQGGQAPLVLRAATALCAAGPVSGTLFLRIETAPGAAHPTLALFDGQGKPRLLLDGPRLAPFTALAGIPLGESA